ncbi:hypothetical protein PR048_006934 [Dryococelus australis]|uniref:Uncharacterized protein n=1 Tax=Dryococelus australis TaxID=614101 RepID=A0ABQ9ICC5_9NEOP|nr:hypothetical protein PR048_006934 [Dryococelus australis]
MNNLGRELQNPSCEYYLTESEQREVRSNHAASIVPRHRHQEFKSLPGGSHVFCILNSNRRGKQYIQMCLRAKFLLYNTINKAQLLDVIHSSAPTPVSNAGVSGREQPALSRLAEPSDVFLFKWPYHARERRLEISPIAKIIIWPDSDIALTQSAANPYFNRATSAIRQRADIIWPEFVGYLLLARFRPDLRESPIGQRNRREGLKNVEAKPPPKDSVSTEHTLTFADWLHNAHSRLHALRQCHKARLNNWKTILN